MKNNSTLKNKLYSALLFSVAIPVLIIFILVFYSVDSGIKSEQKKFAADQLKTIAETVNNKMILLINNSNNIAYNGYILNMLTYDYTSNLKMLTSFYQTMDMLFLGLNSAEISNGSFIIYPPNRTLAPSKYIRDIDTFQDQKLYDRIVNADASEIIWGDHIVVNEEYPNESYICFYRSLKYYQKFIGILEMRVPLNGIEDFANRMIDKKDEIFVLKKGQYSKIYGSNAEITEKYNNNQMKGLTCISQKAMADVEILLVEKNRHLNSKAAFLYLMFVVLFFIVCISVSLMSKMISRKFTRGIERFIEDIEKSDISALGEIVVYDRRDFVEIARIKNKLKDLLAFLNNAYRDILTANQAKSHLEIELLQSNINPHFLYNSLSIIKWNLVKSNNKEMEKLINDMISYYRAILGKGNNIITMEEETDILRKFIEVSGFSRKTTYKFNVHMDAEAGKSYILKLALQPIVENAILHGLGDKPNGEISLSVIKENEYIIIRIFDDGCGMDQEKIDAILSLEYKTYCGGYGIKNTIKRIKAYYGEDCGIKIESNAGEGTLVTVKIRFKTSNEF